MSLYSYISMLRSIKITIYLIFKIDILKFVENYKLYSIYRKTVRYINIHSEPNVVQIRLYYAIWAKNVKITTKLNWFEKLLNLFHVDKVMHTIAQSWTMVTMVTMVTVTMVTITMVTVSWSIVIAWPLPHWTFSDW